jgi:hypothetical protein
LLAGLSAAQKRAHVIANNRIAGLGADMLASEG